MNSEPHQIPDKSDEVRKKKRGIRAVLLSRKTTALFLLLCTIGFGWGLYGKWVGGGPSRTARTCMNCHEKTHPALFADWSNSRHARHNVTCDKCHVLPGELAHLVHQEHLKHTAIPITGVVSPRACRPCHAQQADQFAQSKHAHAVDIVQKLNLGFLDGLANPLEQTTGCFACHGAAVKLKNGAVSTSWPNVGVGRINPDGAVGCCTACHTRHRFSAAEARKPEACGQCHLGPDHPQMEIYAESKHGAIYGAQGGTWSFDPAEKPWRAGRDYRAPTCAACHMSPAGRAVPATHDVTHRLSWELQAPLTVRPQNFQAYPAKTDWQTERVAMKTVCRQCHGQDWIDAHFKNLDRAVALYNDVYFRPAQKAMNGLYEAGLLSKNSFQDEDLEWEFYEFWSHEGRRARMGTAMMAPDYAWWHGFFALKKGLMRITSQAETAIKTGEVHRHKSVPGSKAMEAASD